MKLFKKVKEKYFEELHNDFTNNTNYHLEGDTWTHTMIVHTCASNEYKNIALLHDIGKPLSKMKIDGRTYYRGHAGISTYLSFEYFLKDYITLDELYVINYHGVLWENSKKQIEHYFAKNQNIIEKVKEFSKFDGIGTITSNKKFNKETNYNFEYKLTNYDKKIKKIYLMIGLPGSGKSTYANKLNLPILSRDDIITELYPNLSYNLAWNAVDQKEVDKIFKNKMKEMKQFDEFVIDLTNLSWKSRKKYFSYYRDYEFILNVMLVPFDEIKQRNSEREDKLLANSVFVKMLKHFQLPLFNEGNISKINFINEGKIIKRKLNIL